METRPRMPLLDLPLEHFLTPGSIIGGKTPRNHKRPLSPSRTTPLNPAKRRVLDAEGIQLSGNAIIPAPSFPASFIPSNMHTMTPARPSRLGNGLARNHGRAHQTSSPLLSHHHSPPREVYPKPTVESSTDPQSRHYPGFDIFRDTEHRRGSAVPRGSPSLDGNVQGDKSEEDKENVPLRRRVKKPCSKKRLLSSFEVSDASRFVAPPQMSKVAQPERTCFSTRQSLR